MIASQRSRTLGIKHGVGYHQFLVFPTPSVMPQDSPSIAIETASCGKAPATWTQEINSRTTQEEIGVVIHASARSPQRKGIVAVSPDIAIEDDGSCSFSIDSHLMLGIAWFYCCSIVVVYGQSTDDAVIGSFLQHYHTVVYWLAVILLDDTCFFGFCHMMQVLSRCSPTNTMFGRSTMTFC